MPTRRDVFVNGGIYHVFSKTIDKKIVFKEKEVCLELLGSIKHYRSDDLTLSYSRFKEIKQNNKLILEQKPSTQRLEILSFCLMPNHYHLLLKQKKTNGLRRFMADILNSFTRHYNIKTKRKGSVFLTPFRSRQIVSNEQFIHTSRYIHLNPYSAKMVESYGKLIKYPYSSFIEYFASKNENICNTKPMLKMFGGSREKHKAFVLNNAQHQRTLEYVKYAKDWL
ncbi:MAG: transposase [bacterium]